MSPSRLLWFAFGGASAFWWIRKREEHRDNWASQHGGGPFWEHCMKHSWRLQQSNKREVEAPPRDPSSPAIPVDFEGFSPSGPQDRKPTGFWDPRTDDRLARTVETGVNTVMSILDSLEKTLQEEKARIESRQRGFERRYTEGLPQHPVSPPPEPPLRSSNEFVQIPSLPTSNPSPRSAVLPSSPTKNDDVPEPALIQVLVALEKLNAKLDRQGEPKPAQKDDSFPRLV